MKLKKILALACSLVMTASMFVSTANAAVDGATVTLNGSVENVGGYDYIKVVVSATIPDTLVPYQEIAGTTPPLFTPTFEGKMLQGMGIDIPFVSGATYISNMSSFADYITFTNNTTDSKFQLSYVATGSPDTYYAGDIDVLATLYFYAADMTQTYEFKATKAVIGLVDVNETTGSVIPYEYVTDDFTITNATVAPEEEEEATLALTAEDVTPDEANGYIWKATLTKGAGNITAFDAVFTSGTETAERTIKTGLDTLNAKFADGAGSTTFYVGLKTAKTIDAAEFTVTDSANAKATWPAAN